MVQIAGTYELVSSENYKEYLASLGLPAEKLENITKTSPPLVISSSDDKQIKLVIYGKDKTFVFGEETPQTFPTGQEIKTVITLNGSTLTFKSKTNDGSPFEEGVYKVTDSGISSVTTTAKGLVVKREYKRT